MGDVFQFNPFRKLIRLESTPRSTSEIWAELARITMLGDDDKPKREALRKEMARSMAQDTARVLGAWTSSLQNVSAAMATIPVVPPTNKPASHGVDMASGKDKTVMILIRIPPAPIRITRNPYLTPTPSERNYMPTRIEESWETIPADQLEPGNRFRKCEDSPEHTVEIIAATPFDVTQITTTENTRLSFPAYYQVEYLQRKLVHIPFWRTGFFWLAYTVFAITAAAFVVGYYGR